MTTQPYDMMMTTALFLCGFAGASYSTVIDSTGAFTVLSVVAMYGSIGYAYGSQEMIRLHQLKHEYYDMVRWFTGLAQKFAMLAVFGQCVIIAT